MPSVARRKQKNTQKAQQKKMEREKEAKTFICIEARN